MMKTMMILVTMMISLAGTGAKTVEANVVECMVEKTVAEINLGNSVTCKYSEEYVEELIWESIAELETNWEEEGIPSEECKDEIIELFESVEYDPSFEYGYDLENLQIDYVNILVKYDVLPEWCYGKDFDEIETIDYEIIY